MKVLLIGANSQLGRCIQDRVPADWSMTATTSDELDITCLEQVITAIKQHTPDVIINTAAYTAVDKAENEEQQAFSVNAVAVKNLALASQQVGIRLIHISTDYVFDGLANMPYQPQDVPNPNGVYGRSKLAGELLALVHSSQSQIIRTSWLYSEYGNNFLKTMIRLAEQGQTAVGVVNDQIGCPTYAGNLAQAIIQLLQQPIKGRLFHYCDPEVMSWYDFAKAIFDYRQAQGQSYCRVNPISSDEYPTAARRPAYSVLQGSFDIKNYVRLFDVIDRL